MSNSGWRVTWNNIYVSKQNDALNIELPCKKSLKTIKNKKTTMKRYFGLTDFLDDKKKCI